jgi:hypothetical protein
MLWYKGWLETRFRLLFMLGVMVFILAVQYSARTAVHTAPRAVVLTVIGSFTSILLMMVCAMLAGAGIQTQPSFQATKGTHGSSLFTLALPVSRLRLLAVRATIGWLEVVATIATLCAGMWLLWSPVLRPTATAAQMSEYALTLIVCGSALYFLSVLLASFLDDQWRTWGTMFAAGAMWWLSHKAWLPASVDIVQAIGKGSPLVAHTMPWTAMAFALALAALLFFATLRVVQSREY